MDVVQSWAAALAERSKVLPGGSVVCWVSSATIFTEVTRRVSLGRETMTTIEKGDDISWKCIRSSNEGSKFAAPIAAESNF